jgi:hypothetical protein
MQSTSIMQTASIMLGLCSASAALLSWCGVSRAETPKPHRIGWVNPHPLSGRSRPLARPRDAPSSLLSYCCFAQPMLGSAPEKSALAA